MTQQKLFLVSIVSALMLTACADTRREYKYFDDMHYSPGGDTAKFDRIGKRNYDMAEPENTVTYLGSGKYPYKKDLDTDIATRSLVAPAKFDMNRGRKRYDIFCAPCHGMTGLADGPITKKFAGIKPLVAAAGQPAVQAEGYPIAKLYHIATVGQGLMQGYAPQIQEKDRWDIAGYIKIVLQKRN